FRAGLAYYAFHPLTLEQLLDQLLQASSGTVRCLAAYHAAELGLQQFRPKLEAIRADAPPELAEVVDHALLMLSTRSPTSTAYAGSTRHFQVTRFDLAPSHLSFAQQAHLHLARAARLSRAGGAVCGGRCRRASVGDLQPVLAHPQWDCAREHRGNPRRPRSGGRVRPPPPDRNAALGPSPNPP